MKMNIEGLSRLLGTVSCMMLMLSMTSCLDDSDGVEPAVVAHVSLFHASPDAPDLYVLLDDNPLSSQPLEYSDNTTYLQFYTGNRELAFNSYNASNRLIDTTFNFKENTAYSVFVVNEQEDLSTLLVEDELETPASGKASVRFIQLSPDAPEVDFSVGEENSLEFTNQEFKQATDFTEVDADMYTLTVKATGEEESLVSVQEAEFIAGRVYTVILRGYANPPSGNSNGLNVQIIRNF